MVVVQEEACSCWRLALRDNLPWQKDPVPVGNTPAVPCRVLPVVVETLAVPCFLEHLCSLASVCMLMLVLHPYYNECRDLVRPLEDLECCLDWAAAVLLNHLNMEDTLV
jgi:hypothetical protein